ncbi:MAG: IS200/IS605 family transposase [Bacteroidetes bacterium]|nr:IS200/IS605 family transposase [Bacteroidota bacterium]
MANTYTQIHIQSIFAVQNRLCLIQNHWRDELYKYITGIVQGHNHKMLAINGISSHIHLFFGFRPTQSLSGLMQDVKEYSSKWINQRKLIRGRFSWQEGYGAFSYNKSEVPTIINYVRNQQEHHKKVSFIEEYKEILQEFGIEYDERYIFKAVE